MSVADSGAVEDGAVEDGAVEDGAVEDGAVEDGGYADASDASPSDQGRASLDGGPVDLDAAMHADVGLELDGGGRSCPGEAPAEGERCGPSAEGAECSYPKAECPCGDPSIVFACRGGAWVVTAEEFDCEYSPDACNAPSCAVGPGGPCDGSSDREPCWFWDDRACEWTEYSCPERRYLPTGEVWCGFGCNGCQGGPPDPDQGVEPPPVCGGLILPIRVEPGRPVQLNADGDSLIDSPCAPGGAEGARESVLAVELEERSHIRVIVEAGALVSVYQLSRCPGGEPLAEGCGLTLDDPAGVPLEAGPGVVYLVIDPLVGGPLVARVDVQPVRSACADGEDNDEDGLVDLADPGCRGADDGDEVDPDGPAPACVDGQDNDQDGAADWPDDPECVAAGDPHEDIGCGLDGVQVFELDGAGFHSLFVEGAEGGVIPSPCGPADADRQEAVIVLSLEERSNVRVITSALAGHTTYLVSGCDVPAQDADQCAFNQPRVAFVREPGIVYLVIDPIDPGPGFRVTVEVTGLGVECNDGRDNDGDGLVDRADPGCLDGDTDDREQDEFVRVPECADGIDNDEDGHADWPDDPQCPAAGGPREDARANIDEACHGPDDPPAVCLGIGCPGEPLPDLCVEGGTCCADVACRFNDGRPGTCLNVDTCGELGGVTEVGHCPGGNPVRCCVIP